MKDSPRSSKAEVEIGSDAPANHLAAAEISMTAEPDREAVVRELHAILASPFFRASKRSQQFLSYVVQYRLDGNLEPLKERTIGTDLFNRPAGYATGDDSVVRVQAGEVRRRLDQYYQSQPSESQVQIDLLLGSYAPEFSWRPTPETAPIAPGPEIEVALSPIEEEPPIPAPHSRHHWPQWTAAVVLTALVLGSVAGLLIWRTRSQQSALEAFWAPLLANTRPVLICLPKPISYRPSIALFNRNAERPGEFDNEVDRMNQSPHLKPDDKLQWGDMIEYGDLGVGKGDVKAAIRLSSYLGRVGKDSEVRIGNEYAFEDLRTSPTIIIGAFSNRWTMQMTSNLHFAFAEDHGVFRIQEQGGAGRSWYAKLDHNWQIIEDYGIVTRLVNSSTGQFVVAVAGITSDGSEAAADMATNPKELEKALAGVSSGWKQKNVQIVVKTTVTDAVAGPVEVVATHIW
jgi:hypothetical protein